MEEFDYRDQKNLCNFLKSIETTGGLNPDNDNVSTRWLTPATAYWTHRLLSISNSEDDEFVVDQCTAIEELLDRLARVTSSLARIGDTQVTTTTHRIGPHNVILRTRPPETESSTGTNTWRASLLLAHLISDSNSTTNSTNSTNTKILSSSDDIINNNDIEEAGNDEDMIDMQPINPTTKIIELGCGTGLAGMTFHLCGANHVLLTDGDDSVIENARVNLLLNGFDPSSISCQKLIWGIDDDGDGDGDLECDVVIAADVVYEITHGHLLVKTIERIFRASSGRRGVRGYVVLPRRRHHEKDLQAFEDSLQVSEIVEVVCMRVVDAGFNGGKYAPTVFKVGDDVGGSGAHQAHQGFNFYILASQKRPATP